MNVRDATWQEFQEATRRSFRVAPPARDDRILTLHRNGLRGTEIAAVIGGLTRERVRQIVKRETGESVRQPPRGRPCPVCGVRLTTRPQRADHTTTPVHRAAIRERRVARFWSHAGSMRPGECWEWTGSRYPTGYGHSGTKFVPGGGGYAHRVAYLLTSGDIPARFQIDHLCRNRACVNPAHLEAVSARDNVMRSPGQPCAINANKTHCKYGHPFAGDNLTVDPKGHRRCRACSAARMRTSRRRAAA